LNKIAEHQAIEHDGSIPLFVSVVPRFNMVIDTCDEIAKSSMLSAKSRVEIPG